MSTGISFFLNVALVWCAMISSIFFRYRVADGGKMSVLAAASFADLIAVVDFIM